MKRGRTVPMIDGDEFDFLTKEARRALCVSPAFLRWVKRKYNKRARRIGRERLRYDCENRH